jgi:signal transduction histidine kinase
MAANSRAAAIIEITIENLYTRKDIYSSEKYFRLSFADDGIGFDPNITRRGIGLSNIYERVRLYNGDVQVITAPGRAACWK